MARKPRKPVADFAAYLAVRLGVCVIQAVPPTLALALADLLAWVAYQVDRRHREVAADNLRHAFPDRTPAQIDALVRATYRHFLRVAFEMMLLPRKLHLASWRRYATMYPAARTGPPMYSPRPALIVTGHFGNWEMAGRLTGLFGAKTYAIARVLDNPHLERFLKRFRQGTGQTIIPKKEGYEQLTEVLRAGAKVGILADQDAGQRGLFVDFFGRPASTHKAVALMALEFDAPLIVIGVPRMGEPLFYAVVCEDVIDPRDYADDPNAVRSITQRYTAALERLIRRHPEQYFWLHRRWKHQPMKRVKAAARPVPTPAAA